MDISLSYRLEAAVLLLAGDGTLKERLAAAFREHLDDIDELELPGEVQLEYAQMSRTMHLARALPGDNVVRASVRKLSNEDALRFSALIVRMHALRMQSVVAGSKAPARIGPTPRVTTSLVSLLAIEGGGNGSSRTGLSNNP
jgi:hypothetical protein